MIKNSAYIKKFTPKQKALLEELSAELKIKNASDLLLHCAAEFQSLRNQNARLNKFIEMKTNTIDTLKQQLKEWQQNNTSQE